MDRWRASVEERAARVQEMSGRVAGLTATARDRDGLVEVTVASSGVVTRLHLDDRTAGVPPAQLARIIMAVMGGAQSLLVDRARALTAETLGDSEAGRAVVASFARRLADVPGTDAGSDAHGW